MPLDPPARGTQPSGAAATVASAHANAPSSPQPALARGTAEAALTQLAEGVIIADAAGRITFVNEAAARLHGVARLDVPPDRYAETYQLFTEAGDPFRSEELPLARAVLRGETVLDARWRIRRPDGSEIVAVGSARPVLGPEGQQVAAVLTVRDDSARATAEQADRRATQILERVTDAHVAFDRDLRYVTVNAAGERSMRRPREALLGCTLVEAFPDAAGSESERQYRRVLTEGVEVHFREHYVGDGLDNHVEVDAYPTEEGGVAVFWREITDRVQAERTLRDLNAALTEQNDQLQAQHLELELANQQLQDSAAELELQAEALQATSEQLAVRTAAAERAAAALAESEARHRLAVEAAQLGTWTWDLTTDAATFDARVRELFAFPDDDPQPRVDILATRLHPEDRDRVAAALAAAADPAGTGRYDAEYRIVRPDGTERWALAAGVMRFEGEGPARRPVSLLGTVLDVTERKRAEAAVAASERQWRTMADAIPTLAWSAQADGSVDWYNARWYEYTGTTPEQMAGWGWQAVHDPAALPWVLERWRAGIASGEPVEMTFPLRGADGRFRPFLTRVVPLRDAEGRVVRWFGTNTDVEGERVAREAAERAAAQTARLQAVTAALGRTHTVDDVAAVVVAEIAVTAEAKTAMLALRTFAGDRYTDEARIIRHSGLPDEVLTPFQTFPIRSTPGPASQVLRTGEPVWVTGEGTDTVGARFPQSSAVWAVLEIAAVATLPLTVADEVVGAMSFTFAAPRQFAPDERAFFLTLARQGAQAVERARLFEAEQAARAEAETASRAKSDFLATMSHELRTPLNAIGGYAELIELGIHGPVTDAQHDAIRRIQRSQRHLLGMINDVLNYAKLEAGQVEYRTASVALGDAIDDVELLVGPQLRAKQLKFRRTLQHTSGVRAIIVQADPDKLQQILVNLLSNAIKFTAAGGTITVNCETRGATAIIEVRDTGIGIAADRLEDIFAPFVQVDRRLNAPHEGTGLGLAISRDLARGMGGDLTVETTVGVGSTFTLTLPTASPLPDAGDAPQL